MLKSYVISHNNELIASCDTYEVAARVIDSYIYELIEDLKTHCDEEMKNVFPRSKEWKEIDRLNEVRQEFVRELRNPFNVGQATFYGGFSVKCIKRWE